MIHTKRWWPHILVIVSVMCTYLFATIGSSAPVYADSTPGGNVADPVVRSVDIAEPAVVRILTIVSGHVTVNFAPNTKVVFPLGNSKEYQLELSGTGTFITARGDILTADHVVNPPPDLMQQAASQDIADYINQHPGIVPGQAQVTADQALRAMLNNQLASTATYTTKQSEAFLSNSYTGPLNVTAIDNIPAQLRAGIQIEKESAVDQKDVAIVHASFSIPDLPMVQLGDSSTVQQQDNLTIIGFPGNGDVSSLANNVLTLSVNKVNVSSIKTTDTGAPVIQVGGNVEHGDSGGPALDDQGTVIGVVSFGLQTPDSPGSTAFLQASASARTLLQSLNLDTTPGTFQKVWMQAFNDYASTAPGHWHKALQGFQQIATNYPQFKAVAPYLNFAQTQANAEKVTAPTTHQPQNPTTSALPGWWQAIAMTVGSVLGVLLLVALLFGVIGWQRRKRLSAKGQSTISPAVRPQNALPAASSVAPSGPSQAAASPSRLPVTPPHIPTPPVQASLRDDGMSAFGAPPKRSLTTQTPAPSGSPVTPQGTMTLRPWPCGHMNRSNARFCSVCGESAPEPPTIVRRVEQ